MSESFISDRIIFPSRDGQIAFILAVKNFRKLNLTALAREWKIGARTASSWASAKKHMPYDLALSISKSSGIELPKGIRRQTWKDHARDAGIRGAKMNLLKNGRIGGDPQNRKDKWMRWWNTKGQFKKIPILEQKEIRFPERNAELAEFIGIMLGDGGMAEYHVVISLHKKEFSYSQFISKLIKKLFEVDPKIYLRKDCEGMDIVIQRKKLVGFLNDMGLPIGDKIRQGADIPVWIMENQKFQKACIRGLVDTDGCFFTHTYISNMKKYSYPKIDFTSVSKPLLLSAYKILINLGFSVRICRNEKAIRIESQKDVSRYLKIIGTHNSRYDEKMNIKVRE